MGLPAVTIPFESFDIRIIWRGDDPWPVLPDVCRVLELSNPSMVAKSLDDDEKDALSILDPIGREQMTTIISEAGLYALIERSRKPEAKRFSRWWRHDVMPAIRKTGHYIAKGNEPPVPALDAAVARLEQRIERVEDTQCQIIDILTGQVVPSLEDLTSKGRKDVSAENDRIHLKVTNYFYFGYCPFDENVKIVTDDGKWLVGADGKRVMDFHHQYNKNNSALEATIPLNRAAHKLIENDVTAHKRLDDVFAKYQANVARMQAQAKQLTLL